MSVAKHTIYNFAGALAPAAVSIVVVPIYLRVVGAERYGILVLLWTLSGSFGFLSLGLGPAITQRLATCPLDDDKTKSDIVWTGILTGLATSLFAAILIFLGGLVYFNLFARVDSALSLEVKDSLLYFALATPFGFATGVLQGALQGRRRFLTLNLLQFFSAVASSIIPLLVAIIYGPELALLSAAIFATTLVASVLNFWACKSAIPLLRIAFPNWKTLRGLLHFGGWVSITGFIAPLVFQFDRFIIGTVKGATAVSHYVIPLNLVQRLLLLPASLQSALFPEFASMQHDRQGITQGRALDALSALLTPSAVIGIAVLGPFLNIWVGPTIAASATVPGAILALGFWIHGVTHIASTILLGNGRPDIISKLLLAYVAPYLAIAFVLIDRFGILGAAMAWLLRAGIEPILFRWTLTPMAALRRLLAAFVVVSIMTVICALLDWTSMIYWAATMLAAVASFFIYMNFWSDALLRLRTRRTKGSSAAASL